MGLLNVQKMLKTIIIFVVIITLFFFFKFTLFFLYPFIIGFIFASILHPIVSFLERKFYLSRLLATILVFFFFFLFLSTVFIFIIVELIDGFIYLAEHVPTYV